MRAAREAAWHQGRCGKSRWESPTGRLACTLSKLYSLVGSICHRPRCRRQIPAGPVAENCLCYHELTFYALLSSVSLTLAHLSPKISRDIDARVKSLSLLRRINRICVFSRYDEYCYRCISIDQDGSSYPRYIISSPWSAHERLKSGSGVCKSGHLSSAYLRYSVCSMR